NLIHRDVKLALPTPLLEQTRERTARLELERIRLGRGILRAGRWRNLLRRIGLCRIGRLEQTLKSLGDGRRRLAGRVSEGGDLASEASLLDHLIDARQCALERLRFVGDLELEHRLLFDELARALRILNARNLDDDQ